jgi:hypothetical protein
MRDGSSLPSLPQQEGELSFCCYYLPTVSSTYDLFEGKMKNLDSSLSRTIALAKKKFA